MSTGEGSIRCDVRGGSGLSSAFLVFLCVSSVFFELFDGFEDRVAPSERSAAMADQHYGQHVMLLRTFVGRLCCVSLELLSPGGQWRGRHKGESLAELVRTPWVGPVGVGTLVAWLRFWNGSNVCD